MGDIELDMIMNAKRSLMNFYIDRINELNQDVECAEDDEIISEYKGKIEGYSDLANKLNTSIILLQLGFE